MNGNRRHWSERGRTPNRWPVLFRDPNTKSWNCRCRRATTTGCGRALVRSPSAERWPASRERRYYKFDMSSDWDTDNESVWVSSEHTAGSTGPRAADYKLTPTGQRVNKIRRPADDHWLEPYFIFIPTRWIDRDILIFLIIITIY